MIEPNVTYRVGSEKSISCSIIKEELYITANLRTLVNVLSKNNLRHIKINLKTNFDTPVIKIVVAIWQIR